MAKNPLGQCRRCGFSPWEEKGGHLEEEMAIHCSICAPVRAPTPTLLCPKHNSPRCPHLDPSGTAVAERKERENQGLPPPNQLPGRDLAGHQDRSSWRRKWRPTPIFLPGKSQGHRSLVGYSLWGHKESDTTHAKLGGVYLPHKQMPPKVEAEQMLTVNVPEMLRIMNYSHIF